MKEDVKRKAHDGPEWSLHMYIEYPGYPFYPFRDFGLSGEDKKVKVTLYAKTIDDDKPKKVVDVEITEEEFLKKARDVGVSEEVIRRLKLGEPDVFVLYNIMYAITLDKIVKDPELYKKASGVMLDKIVAVLAKLAELRSRNKLEEVS